MSGLQVIGLGANAASLTASASLIQMLFRTQAIHAQVKRAYGSSRMFKELRNRDLPAGKERVERLMQ
jgi:hypothetical protein